MRDWVSRKMKHTRRVYSLFCAIFFFYFLDSVWQISYFSIPWFILYYLAGNIRSCIVLSSSRNYENRASNKPHVLVSFICCQYLPVLFIPLMILCLTRRGKKNKPFFGIVRTVRDLLQFIFKFELMLDLSLVRLQFQVWPINRPNRFLDID
jgi:hypothetical protein